MGCVYSLSFPNGKQYIGITTKTAAERFAAHSKRTTINNRSKIVHKAIVKYGRENVLVTTLYESDDWDVLCEFEQDMIRECKTRYPDGYNMTDGGDGVPGYIYTPEAKAAVSRGLTGTKRGPHSEETKAKISASLTGRSTAPLSEECKAKISAKAKGRVKTQEHRDKIAATLKGRTMSLESSIKKSLALTGKPKPRIKPAPEDM